MFTKRAAFSELIKLQHQEGEDFEVFFSEFQTLAAHASVVETGLRSMLENKLNGKLTRLLSYQVLVPEESGAFLRLLEVLTYQDQQAERATKPSSKSGPNSSGPRAASVATPHTTVNATNSTLSTATGTHNGPMGLSAGGRKLTDAERRRRHDRPLPLLW